VTPVVRSEIVGAVRVIHTGARVMQRVGAYNAPLVFARRADVQRSSLWFRMRVLGALRV